MFLVDTVWTNFLDHFFDAKNRITNHRKKEQEKKKVLFPYFSLFHSYEKPNQNQAWDLLEAKKKSSYHSLIVSDCSLT